MRVPAPVFVDCYGDLTPAFTQQLRDKVPGLEVYFTEAAEPAQVIERLAGRRHALVYMAYLSEQVLAACPELRTVAYLSTGLATHADLEAADRLGVRIEGVKGYGDLAVAEHAILLMLASLKRLVWSDRLVREGQWGLVGSDEIAGKTIGIVGMGGIGRETARLASALGASVLGWNRSTLESPAWVQMVTIDELLERADIVSIHLALGPETSGFISRERIGQMKPGAIIVNTARGAVLDEGALIDAIDSGQIGHAALDVFDQEPLTHDNRLLQLDQVTVTPHSAWYTAPAIARLLAAGLDLLHEHVAGLQADGN